MLNAVYEITDLFFIIIGFYFVLEGIVELESAYLFHSSILKFIMKSVKKIEISTT